VPHSGVRWTGAFSQLRRSAAGLVPGLVLALLLPSLPSLAADGDPKPASERPELRRELAGHYFLPSRFSDDPFVSTFIASETGVGFGSAPGRTFDVLGKPVSTATYEVGAFAQYLDYQYGFLDWWAFRISVRVLVYTGTNSSGIAGIGSTLAATPTLGSTVSFKVGERLRLGASMELAFGPAVFFNVVEAVVDSIQRGEVTTPVNSFSQFTTRPTLLGAWAIHRALGLTFSLGYQHTVASSSGAVDAEAKLFQANTTLDFDLKELNWAPIGLLAGFTTQFGVAEVKFVSFRYNFGIFYTAVRPLNVGLEIVYNRAPVVGSTKIFLSSVLGYLLLQYNFN
jgi:hypothetical protein